MTNYASPILARAEKSIIGRWWWSVDRWTLAALFALIAFGVVLVTAASPAVAERLGLPPFYFVYRHLAFLLPAAGMMIFFSLLGRRLLRNAAIGVLGVTLVLMAAVLVFGVEIKGATRWIHLPFFSLQPSEFVKPSFAVVSAWLMSQHMQAGRFVGHQIAAGIFAGAAALLLLQPDLGMTLVLAAIWGVQVFLAGLPMFLVVALAALAAAGIFGAYMLFPHVASRIDRFLDPSSGDNYQVQKSLDAFSNGGLFGTGPAHGMVKLNLPDAHADFIFAVCGEELGLVAAVFLVAVFCFILVRSILRIVNSDDMFIVLGTGGLLTQFALQSLIHMGSSLQLLPAKGMTLPFISYGGSSLLSLGLGMGMLLSLTRKRTQGLPAAGWRGRMGEAHG